MERAPNGHDHAAPPAASPLDAYRTTIEQFMANNVPVAGKQTAFRELSDQQLLSTLESLMRELAQAQQVLQSGLNATMQLSQFVAVIKFEMERRAKSIRIASDIRSI